MSKEDIIASMNGSQWQETLKYEQDAYKIFLSHFPEYEIIETNKNKLSEMDSFLIKNKNIIGVIEVKGRHITEEDLKNKWDNKLMIVHDKLVFGLTLAKRLAVYFFGFMYLVPEKKLIVIKIADDDGKLLVKIKLENTTTKKTIREEDGKVNRNNCFIDIQNATILTEKEQQVVQNDTENNKSEETKTNNWTLF